MIGPVPILGGSPDAGAPLARLTQAGGSVESPAWFFGLAFASEVAALDEAAVAAIEQPGPGLDTEPADDFAAAVAAPADLTRDPARTAPIAWDATLAPAASPVPAASPEVRAVPSDRELTDSAPAPSDVTDASDVTDVLARVPEQPAPRDGQVTAPDADAARPALVWFDQPRPDMAATPSVTAPPAPPSVLPPAQRTAIRAAKVEDKDIDIHAGRETDDVVESPLVAGSKDPALLRDLRDLAGSKDPALLSDATGSKDPALLSDVAGSKDPALLSNVTPVVPHVHVAPRAMAPAREVDAAPLPSPVAGEPAEAATQIVRSLRWQWTRGIGDAQIELEPRHFGDARITVRLERQQVVVRVAVESAVVREWLETHHAWLRDNLASHGLVLDRLEIQEPDVQTGDEREAGDRPPSRDQHERRLRRPHTGSRFEVVV